MFGFIEAKKGFEMATFPVAPTPKRDIRAFVITDATNSRVLGVFHSVSELGAKRKAAKATNTPYAWLVAHIVPFVCSECGRKIHVVQTDYPTLCAICANARDLEDAAATEDADTASESVGDMVITVTRDGVDWEGRTQYTYAVTVGDKQYTGNDLHTGVGMDQGPRAMLGTLASFLSAAGDAYSYSVRASKPLEETENGSLFPYWVAVAAYHNDDTLVTLSLEIEFAEEGE